MPSILIVEDCRDIALILANHLGSAGYRVTIADDGAAALAILRQGRTDCVLVDLMMPVMTGIELLQHMKEDPALASTAVVLVSARVGEGRTHVFTEREADYCVGKPFTRRQILDAVAAALDERARRRRAHLKLVPPTQQGYAQTADINPSQLR